ncbi:uncharacterized protein LOC112463626 isoform X2 [Temnothorax curvispinosus]|nr:uncharacterized protein LOC112463626 isoform X2 [Temnothorax curvispinosus]XP_024885890.1 uncharacterized protein LOC112463626 isoform X2 [Temnothorax curvispinosus]
MGHLKRNHLEVIEAEPTIKKMHLNSESNDKQSEANNPDDPARIQTEEIECSEIVVLSDSSNVSTTSRPGSSKSDASSSFQSKSEQPKIDSIFQDVQFFRKGEANNPDDPAGIQTKEIECSEIAVLSDSSNVSTTSRPGSSKSDASSTFPSKSKQPKIDKTFRDVQSFRKGGYKAGQITNAILFMIAKDNQPFQIVEDEGFQHFVKTAIPLYKVPDRKSITRLMEEKYELLSMVMKTKLSAVDAITLTSDV